MNCGGGWWKGLYFNLAKNARHTNWVNDRSILLEAGNALAAVATTIAKAANQTAAVSKAVDEAQSSKAPDVIEDIDALHDMKDKDE